MRGLVRRWIGLRKRCETCCRRQRLNRNTVLGVENSYSPAFFVCVSLVMNSEFYMFS